MPVEQVPEISLESLVDAEYLSQMQGELAGTGRREVTTELKVAAYIPFPHLNCQDLADTHFTEHGKDEFDA